MEPGDIMYTVLSSCSFPVYIILETRTSKRNSTTVSPFDLFPACLIFHMVYCGLSWNIADQAQPLSTPISTSFQSHTHKGGGARGGQNNNLKKGGQVHFLQYTSNPRVNCSGNRSESDIIENELFISHWNWYWLRLIYWFYIPGVRWWWPPSAHWWHPSSKQLS